MTERGDNRQTWTATPQQAPAWLERLAMAGLHADPLDSRLGDLSEQYIRTHERTRAWFGAKPSATAIALAELVADLRYLAATANVMLFARAIEPGQRLVENGGVALIAVELRERTMAMLRIFVRKVVLPVLLLVCSALVLNSAWETWTSWKQTEALMVSLQREKAEAAAQRIGSFVSEIERQLGWVASAQWAALPIDQKRFDYVRLLRQVPAITSLVQLDREGREQLNVSRLSMDVVGSGVDRSTEPAFADTKTKSVYFGPLYFRKQSEPYITIAVRHGGNTAVTVAEVNLKLVWDAVRSIKVGEVGFGYVVDSQRRLVSHPDIAFVLRGSDVGAVPQVAAALANPSSKEPFEGKIVSPDKRAESVLSVHASIPALGWLVFVDVPTAELQAPFWGAVIRTGGLLALGLALAAIAILIAVRPITIGGLRPA
jgi:hypothetical protein